MSKKLIVFFHLFILALLLFGPVGFNPKKMTSLKIHAIRQQSAKITNTKKTPSSPAPKKASQKPVNKPKSEPKPAQKLAPKTAAKPTPQTKPKVVAATKKEIKPKPKNSSLEIQDQKLKETIAKIEEKIDKLEQLTQSEKTYPETRMPSLLEEESDEIGELTPSGIIEYLFELLELPENGKVLVELRLNQKGCITDVQVLETESEKNRTYLMEALKNLNLPFDKKEKVPSSLRVCFSNLNA